MFLIGILSVIQGMVGLALFWGEPDRKWQILISIAFLGLGSVFIFATL
jgi:hypothetical protein